MAKSDSIFCYVTKKTEKFVEMCHCKIYAMLPTKGSSTYAKHRHTHVQEKEDNIVNEYNVLLYN
jgi:hypothetical protein